MSKHLPRTGFCYNPSREHRANMQIHVAYLLQSKASPPRQTRYLRWTRGLVGKGGTGTPAPDDQTLMTQLLLEFSSTLCAFLLPSTIKEQNTSDASLVQHFIYRVLWQAEKLWSMRVRDGKLLGFKKWLFNSWLMCSFCEHINNN